MKKVRVLLNLSVDTIVEVPDKATTEEIEYGLISVSYAPSSLIFQMTELELDGADASVMLLATEGKEDLVSCEPLD